MQFKDQTEFSATAYFACLQEMMTSYHGSLLASSEAPKMNIESLSYCYSAIISQLDFGVISNQEQKIVKTCSDILTSAKYPGMAQKYALICIQFVLHSKSEAQWNNQDTVVLLNALLNECTNTQKQVVQKQAIKSICIILQNNQIRKLTSVTQSILQFVKNKINQILNASQMNVGSNKACQIDANSQSQAIKLLNFLSGALQIMPIELCAELTPLIHNIAEIEDSNVKIHSYLTIEVLFASRRFESSLASVSARSLAHLLDNSEIIQNVYTEVDDEGNQVTTKVKVDKKDEQRVIAYIQALSQVILNISTTNVNSQTL